MAAPRAYSYLCPFTREIKWKFPGESSADQLTDQFKERNLKKRTRLETDSEVKERLKKSHLDIWNKMQGDESGHKLDQILKHFGLNGRLHIEE